MVDSTLTYERCMEAAGVALSSGDRISAERAFRAAVQAVQGAEGLHLEHASALTRLGSIQQEMGNDREAEECFRQALAVSEGHLGEDHPDLVLLLNDLTRLYLRQSQHALAEPLLLRLLAIKRSKGDDHPEVATVLASLATVRQTLGRYEAAEQLWRRVLGIRERTLAPNHFSLATAIEHLAETCAARGKLREALQYYQRAHAIREHTLGSDHPSLRVSRERIADLQLQASEDSLGGETYAIPSQHETRRISSGDATASIVPPIVAQPVAAAAATPAPAPAPVPEAYEKFAPPAPAPVVPTPAPTRTTAAQHDAMLFELETVVNSVAAASMAAAAKPQPAPAAAPAPAPRKPAQEKKVATVVVPPPSPAAMPVVEAAQPLAEAVPYLNVLMDIKQELEDGEEPADEAAAPAPAGRAAAMAGAALALFQKHRVAAIVGIAVITLPLAAWAVVATRSSTSGFVASQTVAQAPRADSVPLSNVAFPELAGRPATPALKDTATTKTTSNRGRTEEKPATRNDEPSAPEAPSIVIPTVPQTNVGKIDSVVRAMTIPVRTATESTPLTLNAGALLEASRAGGGFETVSTGVRARLIGNVPTPRYPASLLGGGIGGEVRVRFDVDTTGRPVMNSFTVVSSPDAALTAAVRKVIPSMRFEPARTSGPDAHAVVDKMEMGFTFAPPTRD